MQAFFRGFLATLVGSVALLGASTAFAVDACLNDTDCPGGGMVCGGDVCNWHKPLTAPADPNKPYTCNPAGTDPKGQDGWCTGPSADNCKCKGEGAKCVGTYCSFTKASDAPAGSGGSGSAAGGSPSSAGTTTSAAGMTTSAAGTTTSAAGTASAPAASSTSSGCSISAPIGTRGGTALALGLLGVGFALSRRRR